MESEDEKFCRRQEGANVINRKSGVVAAGKWNEKLCRRWEGANER